MTYLYHGSSIAEITNLKANSLLHNTDKRVLYLTDNIPYALLYIWDEKHNCYRKKHVTGWVKEGITYYEEQFPNQLETFYNGVQGYLYSVLKTDEIKAFPERECLYYSIYDMSPVNAVFVCDVYNELMKYEKTGELKVLRYNEQSAKRQKELVDMMSVFIVKSNFFENDVQESYFFQKHFAQAWEKAITEKRPNLGII